MDGGCIARVACLIRYCGHAQRVIILPKLLFSFDGRTTQAATRAPGCEAVLMEPASAEHGTQSCATAAVAAQEGEALAIGIAQEQEK